MANNHAKIIIIPARLAARRLPNKPLADIAGKPMIQHVWERARAADIGPVYVATDHHKIADVILAAGGKAVITGDVTQVDLPRHQKSGLVNALEVLAGEQEIGVTRFDSRDVVRHPLVQRIVEAYDRHERDTDPQR